MNALFPLVFASEEARLLTGIAIGMLFGFSLERGGFANARKLAAQFYLYDMTVFKVMFTAIIVAMVGFYALAGAGFVDMSRMWINPTFLWAEVIGGFLLGVGFIMSGLCPGTAVVSMASGRYDGAVTLVGIVIGTALFALAVDWFPGLLRLYEAGGQVSLLPALFHLPTPAVMLAVVAMAAGGFIAAERVERVFRAKYGMIELTPPPTPRAPRAKFALAGSLGVVVLGSLAFRAPGPERTPIPLAALEPLALAGRIIAHDPLLVILDARSHREGAGLPGAYAVDDSAAALLLAGLPPSVHVVVFDERGDRHTGAGDWPRTLNYRYLRGGLAAWKADVLAPAAPESVDLAARARAARQNQVAAYFSGAGVAAPAPPAAAGGAGGGGGGGKKKAGGC